MGLGKSDPYFVIKALPRIAASVPTPPGIDILYEGGVKKPAIVYRSEIIKENLKPVWKEFNLDIDLAGGMDASLTIHVFDWVVFPIYAAK